MVIALDLLWRDANRVLAPQGTERLTMGVEQLGEAPLRTNQTCSRQKMSDTVLAQT